MPEIVNSCPLCTSDTSAVFDQRRFRGQPVTNMICNHCGLVYQTPRLTPAESLAFYEAEYRLLYQGQEGPNPKDLAVQAARAKITLDFIGRHIKSCTRVLDIGCSTGILLAKLKEHYQAQSIGIEPGNTYRLYAQSSGLEVYPSLEEIQNTGVPRFDLISMMHVLEHLPNPKEYLKELREKELTENGWLLLEVPNLYAHDCFEVAHLISFSPHTLLQVVQQAGYRVIQLRAHGLPRSRLIPLYLSLLAQPDDRAAVNIKPDHLVRIQRQAGMLYRRAVTRLFPGQAWISPEGN